MLYDIFRPSFLKIIIVSIIFLVFTSIFFLNLGSSKTKKLPASLKKLTMVDYITIASVVLYLPIAPIASKLGNIIPDYHFPLSVSVVITALQYSLIYYLFLSLMFYLLKKWFKAEDTIVEV